MAHCCGTCFANSAQSSWEHGRKLAPTRPLSNRLRPASAATSFSGAKASVNLVPDDPVCPPSASLPICEVQKCVDRHPRLSGDAARVPAHTLMSHSIPQIPWSVCYVLDSLAIAWFAISYYRNCYRRGYRIDIWHAQVFLLCVFPNMLMLPFAKSELNVLVLGRDLNAVTAVLPLVFLITMIGYLAVLGGSGLWRLQIGIGLRDTAAKVLDIVPRASMMLMSSRSILIFQTALCLLLQSMMLAVYFSQSGFAFDL